jgi:hypothetical protein
VSSHGILFFSFCIWKLAIWALFLIFDFLIFDFFFFGFWFLVFGFFFIFAFCFGISVWLCAFFFFFFFFFLLYFCYTFAFLRDFPPRLRRSTLVGFLVFVFLSSAFFLLFLGWDLYVKCLHAREGQNGCAFMMIYDDLTTGPRCFTSLRCYEFTTATRPTT